MLYTTSLGGVPHHPRRLPRLRRSKSPGADRTAPTWEATAEGAEGGDDTAASDAPHRRARGPGGVHSPASVVPPHALPQFLRTLTREVELDLHDLHTHATRRSLDAWDVRRERAGIFRKALRSFSAAFKTYRLFLAAVAEEQEEYISALENDRTRAEEARRAENAAAKKRMEALEAELREMKEAYAAKCEQAAAVDPKEYLVRIMNELTEERLLRQDAQAKALESEKQVVTLKRQVELLSITTLSDKIEAAQAQVIQWRSACTQREAEATEAGALAHDLKRDMRTLVREIRVPLETLRLTARGRLVCAESVDENENSQIL